MLSKTPVFVTFRDQTTGRINDLLIDEHKACAQSQNLLSYLAGALLNYKDEGIEFAPSIILCDELNKFLQSFPGALAHTIGTAPLDPSSGPQILKDCAPLSGQNWFIFIERIVNDRIRYGIFTYFKLPTAIPLHEGISLDASCFCILLRKISTNTIELRGAKGSHLTLIFSTVRETTTAQTKPIDEFAVKCCTNVPEPSRSDAFTAYFIRLLDAALTSSHGTILICARESVALSDIPELQDAVPVSPLLDFFTAFADFQTEQKAGAILALQRCEELLSGFLRCDGMIVFDTVGRVRSYRVFYRPTNSTTEPTKVVGGARRRAFESMKALVGDKLISILFRSQDGLTLHHGAAE